MTPERARRVELEPNPANIHSKHIKESKEDNNNNRSDYPKITI